MLSIRTVAVAVIVVAVLVGSFTVGLVSREPAMPTQAPAIRPLGAAEPMPSLKLRRRSSEQPRTAAPPPPPASRSVTEPRPAGVDPASDRSAPAPATSGGSGSATKRASEAEREPEVVTVIVG